MSESSREAELLWVRESERLNARYVVEFVIAFGICPFAKSAWEEGRVLRSVLLQADDTLASAIQTLQQWSERAELEVGLLIFPRLRLGRGDLHRFTNRLIQADRENWGRRSSPFAMAAFHPDAALDTTSADRLVPFVRRTPDPTIQVVSVAALERVRGAESGGTQFVDPKTFDPNHLARPGPSLRSRIAEHNLKTVLADPTRLGEVLKSIDDDRERTHARLERDTPLDEPTPGVGRCS